ncbi:PREDICTED: aspartyl/asparaginyl beta-hydroxylase-like isoform X2 [Miniopterus natalensis]|uniref:aspartyl/asparaginyl beta-hydroxylase-like isoform X2 n=1 Tax=Miniopterus natalensis TaxID=291302 RepID=UPI0007A6B936|nr:PREDICTED: aspartyl/asparaginyl beta-hydroxylase-like isoform X2 [Miniopterus natalensis]
MDEDTKHGGHKNGRKGVLSGSSFFTWFMVIALLGVWTSVAVVWFDLVDYEEVLGKLGVYDADGDGDFDVDDAKVLLGLKERSASEPTVPPEEPERYPEEQVHEGTGPQHFEDEIQEEIHSSLHETVYTEHDVQPEEDRPAREEQPEDDDFLVGSEADDRLESLEIGTFQEETEDSYHVEETASQAYNQDVEEMVYEHENPDSTEPALDDGERTYHDADDVTHQDYDQQVYEPSESEGMESSEARVPPAEEQQEIPPGMTFVRCIAFSLFV